MMKLAIAIYLFFVSLAVWAELPDENPQSAVFVTSCHQIITAVIVMADGKTLLFDGRSDESADDVKLLASRSKTPARVYEVGCYREAPISI